MWLVVGVTLFQLVTETASCGGTYDNDPKGTFRPTGSYLRVPAVFCSDCAHASECDTIHIEEVQHSQLLQYDFPIIYHFIVKC